MVHFPARNNRAPEGGYHEAYCRAFCAGAVRLDRARWRLLWFDGGLLRRPRHLRSGAVPSVVVTRRVVYAPPPPPVYHVRRTVYVGGLRPVPYYGHYSRGFYGGGFYGGGFYGVRRAYYGPRGFYGVRRAYGPGGFYRTRRAAYW